MPSDFTLYFVSIFFPVEKKPYQCCELFNIISVIDLKLEWAHVKEKDH